MSTTQQQPEMTYEQLAPYAGRRVRIGYPNGMAKSGALTAHPLRNCDVVDYRIDGFGGFLYGYESQLEVMGANGRYELVWERDS